MEFGCGTGLISMALAPEMKHVLAVDMSENMLAVLEKKIRSLDSLLNLSGKIQECLSRAAMFRRYADCKYRPSQAWQSS